MKNVWLKRLCALATVLVMSLTLIIGLAEEIIIDRGVASFDERSNLQVEMDVLDLLPVEPELADDIIDLLDVELEQEDDMDETNVSSSNKGIPAAIKIGIKETYALNTKKLGSNLSFRSSKSNVATVNRQGVIKGMKSGRSTITCYSKEL